MGDAGGLESPLFPAFPPTSCLRRGDGDAVQHQRGEPEELGDGGACLEVLRPLPAPQRPDLQRRRGPAPQHLWGQLQR